MSKDTPKPNTTNSELDEILHEFSVAESLSETQLSDKLKRGVITADEFDERLVDSYREHKAEAKARIKALIAAKVEELQSKEAKLLNAVGLMYAQYCREPYGHHFMGAGEAAIEILEDYGVHAEDWEWTDKSYDKLEEVVKSLQPESRTRYETR
jgi:hypothetical protein